MKTISGIEFASEHNGTDVFRLIELAYEQGQKDGHSEQLGTNLAEVGTDLISRQQVIDVLDKIFPADPMRNDFTQGIACGAALAKTYVEDLLPAQPKRGKWIEDKGQQTLMKNFIERGEVWRVCSVCGAGHMIGHKYAIDKAYHDRHHNFCPHCGADMREETT